MKLYPLKFSTIFKEKSWGGHRLLASSVVPGTQAKYIGEQWLLSGLEGEETEVANGFLEENDLNDLTEVYMGELLGDAIYQQFGEEFPLLVRLLDARENSTLLVHPDDATAAERHHAYGKQKVWYVMHAQEGAECLLGFKTPVSEEVFLSNLESGTIENLLHHEPVKKGDALLIDPGTVHALGKGLMVAEIGQASDIAYRLYDWGRDEPNRDIHLELAQDIIQYQPAGKFSKLAGRVQLNDPQPLFNTPNFNINSLHLTQPATRQLGLIDSFVVYLCTEGKATIGVQGSTELLMPGDLLLIPASVKDEGIILTPAEPAHLLEIFLIPQ